MKILLLLSQAFADRLSSMPKLPYSGVYCILGRAGKKGPSFSTSFPGLFYYESSDVFEYNSHRFFVQWNSQKVRQCEVVQRTYI